MIAKLIGWCARNRVAVLLLAAVGVAAGILSLRRVPLDAIDLPTRRHYRAGTEPHALDDQVTA